jgi:hypothetical protein
VVDPEDIILNCYRLAYHYHQNPEIFTEMSASRINDHVRYTNRVIMLREREIRRRQEENG